MPEVKLTLSEEDIRLLADLTPSHTPTGVIHHLDNAAIAACRQWIEDNQPKEPWRLTFTRGDKSQDFHPANGQTYLLGISDDNEVWMTNYHGDGVKDE